MKFEDEEQNMPLHSFHTCSSVSNYLDICLQIEELRHTVRLMYFNCIIIIIIVPDLSLSVFDHNGLQWKLQFLYDENQIFK